MSSIPDISVVMSVYNGADRLRETMESVLSQEGVSLEFIVIDDGSTDGSDVTLADYARHDARIRILTLKRGPPARTSPTPGLRKDPNPPPELLSVAALERFFNQFTPGRLLLIYQ